jgi:hypothetical protein
MKTLAATLAAAVTMTVAGPVLAHHSYAMFDSAQSKQLDGVVETFKWTNPHSYIEVLVPGKDGQMEKWGVECGSPAQLVRAGWRSTTLKPGDHVVVTVHPLRSGELGGAFVSVQTPDGHVMKAS